MTKAIPFYEQVIICDEKLKISQVLEQNWNNLLYEENRDENGIIINIKEYNPNSNKLEIILFNYKSLLIKYDRSFYQ